MPRRAAKSRKTKSTKPWGGRFRGGTDARVEAFTESVSFDYRLAPHDVLASIAHAEMLGAQGIIAKKDARAIVRGLKAILREMEAGGVRVPARARRRAHERRGGAHEAHRRRRRQTAHRPEPERPGGHFAQAVAQRPGRRDTGGAFSAQARSSRAGGGPRRYRDARLHASTARAARIAGAPPARVFPDAQARRGAVHRSARPGQRPAAGGGRAGRHEPPDRQENGGEKTRFRLRHREQHGCGERQGFRA